MLSTHIFRQYDIRGIVGPDLNEETAYAVGRAYGTMLRARTPNVDYPQVALGHDNRPSSPGLAAAFRDGLLAAGTDVMQIGTVPTPVLYYAGAKWETDGAVQITGSHNPAEYNGIKMTMHGAAIYGADIQEIRRIIETGAYAEGRAEGDHAATYELSVLETYVRDIGERFAIERPLKVVVDCGNGTGSVVAERLLAELGANVEVVPLFCESDGTFPNHHPDPVVDKNLEDLIAKVREAGADLGIAFDGDADRIGAVDEKGNIIRGDTLLILYALDLIQRRGKGQKVVFDVKCSQAVTDVIAQAGGEPIMAPTGHSLIKKRMKETGALLAGELSGHIMFGDDYYGFDDALYAACLLISIVSRSDRALSERVAALPSYVSTPELRYPITEEGKKDAVRNLLEHFRLRDDVLAIIDVDGARVVLEGGWGLIRASNTEPVLVGRMEAQSEARLQEIRAALEAALPAGSSTATIGH